MGGAAALLERRRLASFALLGAAVGSYYVWRKQLPDAPHWLDVVLLVVAILPAVLGLILLTLPLWRAPAAPLLAATLVLAAAAAACELADYELAANFAKLFACAFFGFWVLRFFYESSWVVVIALLVPIADSISVFWRHGVTHTITEKHFDVYAAAAISLVVPHHSGAFIGPPDVIFFALFLAAADRFRLRVGATFAGMVLFLGAGFVVAIVTDSAGIPALVPIALGFLVPNADLLRANWSNPFQEPAA